MMREPRDECRDVELASGETIRVRGRRGLGPAGVAALSELVEAVRSWAREQGLEVASTGRMPREVVAAWVGAHPQEAVAA